MPAARLLDTVELQMRDYSITHKQSSPPLWQECMDSRNDEQKKTENNSRLAGYKSPVFVESDRIDWTNQTHYKDQQTKQVAENDKSHNQAEEEAETDEEMIDYGVKMSSKTVRCAVRSYKTREWSIRSRMEYYRNSVKRLRETNKKRKWFCLFMS